jgi:MOSC domain-containing protein YiiM
MSAHVTILESVNIANPRSDANEPATTTGIDKGPVAGPMPVRDPGPKTAGLGSGIVGDMIGDGRHHGGSEQAVYAFAREDLDDWQVRLGRELTNGFFGENLTTRGLDVSGARLGERWRIGDTVELEVTSPRIPCSTFRGWVDEVGWLKTFTQAARPGAYLRVVTPGQVSAGDPIEVVHRPTHDVTIALTFRALTTERDLLPHLFTARDDLIDELRELATGRETMEPDTDDQV